MNGIFQIFAPLGDLAALFLFLSPSPKLTGKTREVIEQVNEVMNESLQKPFIHDLVHLFDDLTSLAGQLGTGAQEQKKRGQIAQWCENLENTIHSVMEILHRLE